MIAVPPVCAAGNRRLFEQIENHLFRCHQPQFGQRHTFVGLIVAQGYADLVNLALIAQIVQGFQPIQFAVAQWPPRMQLIQVDPFHPQAAQRRLDMGAKVPVWEAPTHLGRRIIGAGPDCGLGLGGDVNLAAAPLPQRLADHCFGMASAVKLCRIYKIDPHVKGVQQGAD